MINRKEEKEGGGAGGGGAQEWDERRTTRRFTRGLTMSSVGELFIIPHYTPFNLNDFLVRNESFKKFIEQIGVVLTCTHLL